MSAYAGDRTTGFASPAADAIEGPIDLPDVLDLDRPLPRVCARNLVGNSSLGNLKFSRLNP